MTQKALLRRRIPQGGIKNERDSFTPQCEVVDQILLSSTSFCVERDVISGSGSLAEVAAEGHRDGGGLPAGSRGLGGGTEGGGGRQRPTSPFLQGAGPSSTLPSSLAPSCSPDIRSVLHFCSLATS